MAHVPAKVTRPRIATAVPRARLHRDLDAIRRRSKVAWIVGQPGSGKTTLVSSWVDARRIPALWITLDAGDADLATFFHYLALAARSLTRRRLSLPAFGPEYGGEVDLFARNFFRAVYAALPRGAVVVLDDCHEVPPDADAIRVLRAAIDELAPGVALVLASRTPLPAALARQRANGVVAVLGGRTLELTPMEARALARARGFRGGPASIEEARARVGGWAAGLVLALAAADEADEADEAGAVGASAATFDYFAGEVFERADAATRRVLLEAALLEAPTAALLARVTGEPGAGRLLARLARRGLFVSRRDAGGAAFELHALFRQFLLARGRDELPPGRADEVRRAAAAALAARGGADAETAIALLQEVGAHEDAAAVVVREAGPALRAGRSETVVRWIEGLPAAVRDADPWMRCWHGTALATREPVRARALLEPALAAFEERGDAAGVWLSWAALVESIVIEWSDFTALAPRMAELERLRARHPFPSREIELRVVLVTVAVLAHLAPEQPRLAAWGDRALAVALEPGDPRVRLVAGAYFHMYRSWWFGELEPVRPLVAALAPLARDPAADPAAAILWLTMEATFHAAVGDPETAARCADEARRRAADSGVHAWDVALHVHGLWTALGDDDVGSARALTARLAAQARPGNPMDRAFVRTYEGLVALRARDPGAAAGLAEEAISLARRTRYATVEVMAGAALARAHALAGRQDAALEACRAARAVVAPLGSGCFEHVLGLVEAERHLRAGERDAAGPALSRALAHAEDGRAHGRYVFSRPELAALVAEALRRGIEVHAARALVRARGLRPPVEAGAEWPRDVTVRALGELRVEREGAIVGGGRGPRRPLDVLRVLVALGGREVPEARVAEALWPDSDGDASHHALETALYRLRRLVGADAVVQRAGRISLSIERCWVDAMELDTRLAAALAALQPRRAPARPDRADAERIAELYAGPLLADCDAAWAADAREALRRKLARWLAALEALPGDPAGAARLRAELAARDGELRARALLRLA